jgi:hypothetical protein
MDDVIPAFDEGTGNLPPGIHDATWEEICERYGYTPGRLKLLEGLEVALDDLRRAGCRTVFLDGSFVSAKEEPKDFDACWDAAGVNADDLHPALLGLKFPRAAMKRRYQGDVLIAHSVSEPFGPAMLEFFQKDRDTGEPKGIIRIALEAP